MKNLTQHFLSAQAMRTFLVTAFVLLMGATNSLRAQLNITNYNTAASENFNTIGSSATAALPAAFTIGTSWSATPSAATKAAGTTGTGVITSSSLGGAYNFANGITASSTERAIGYLLSSTYGTPRSICMKIDNNTGATITSLTIAWNYEKYRSGTSASNWTFFTGTTTTPATAQTTGDLANIADANNTTVFAATQTAKSVTITGLSIANGASYYCKWTYTVTTVAGSQAWGIDDVSATSTCTAPTNLPTATAPTSISTSAFTANWTCTVTGVTGYLLDVSTTSDFSSGVTTYNITSSSTKSRSQTGLSNANLYYYRVRSYNGTSPSVCATTYSNVYGPVKLNCNSPNGQNSVKVTSITADATQFAGTIGYAATANNTGAMIFTYTTNSSSANPTSGVDYNVNDLSGNWRLVYKGTDVGATVNYSTTGTIPANQQSWLTTYTYSSGASCLTQYSSGAALYATVNPNAVFTVPTVCSTAGAQDISVPYSSATGVPDEYRIVWDASNSNAQAAGFVDVPAWTALPASPITLSIPGGLTAGGLYTGTYYFRNSSTGFTTTSCSNCGGAARQIAVNVSASVTTPTFTAEPGATSSLNTDVTYTTQSGKTTYIWSVPGILNTDYSITSGGLSGTDFTVTLKWLTTGDKTVTVSYTSGSCAGYSPASNTTAVSAGCSAPTIASHPSGGTQALCVGGTPADLSVTVSGTVTYYEWYKSSNSNGSSPTLVATNTSSSATDTYTPSNAAGTLYYYVIAYNSVTCPVTSNVSGAIVVSALPSAGTATSSPVDGSTACAGSSISSTFGAGSGGAGTINDVTESNTDGAGWVSYTSPNSITTATTSVAFRTYRTADGSGCTTSGYSSVATVNVVAVPSAPTVNVSDNCGSTTLSTTETGSLLWSPGGATTSSITVTSSGSYTVVQTVNGCTSAAGSGTATPLALPSVPSVSVTNNCDGTSTLSTTATGSLAWNTGATTSAITVSSAGTYSVTTTVDGCTSAAGTGSPILAACTYNLTVKAFLQGYYLGAGNMSPLIHLLGYTTTATAVDTIAVELHDSSSPYSSLYSYEGVINSSGNIVCSFPGAASGSYYIVVKHRNSLETWSAAAHSASTIGTYDFTTSATQASGSNMVNLGSGVYGIYSGDVNQSGAINATDNSSVQSVASAFQVGVYNLNDVSGDGFVDEDDVAVMLNNTPLNLSSQHP